LVISASVTNVSTTAGLLTVLKRQEQILTVFRQKTHGK
jgi:hypothetical protein